MAVRVEIDDAELARMRPRTGAVVERVCEAVEKDAKAVCPRDTGDLEESIGHEVVGTAGRVGSNLDYAAAVEMGFHGTEHVREYEIKKGPNAGKRVRAHERHANTPSQPYLRPALYVKRSP
jgi:phage gpG-like protein